MQKSALTVQKGSSYYVGRHIDAVLDREVIQVEDNSAVESVVLQNDQLAIRAERWIVQHLIPRRNTRIIAAQVGKGWAQGIKVSD